MNRFAKFSWGVLGWTILNILWGALVRATKSGTGCGNHWPDCNGEIIPTPQRIETLLEFAHRALSGVALLLVLALLIWGWRKYSKGSPVRMAVSGSAVFILLEAALGAGLVLIQQKDSPLYACFVALHLLNTFILLAFLALTAWWASGGKTIALKNKGQLPLLFGLGLAGVALIGMTGAITALSDTLYPVKSLAAGLAQDADANANFLIRLRVIHPLIAIFVAVYTLSLASYIYGKFNGRVSQKLSLTLSTLVLVQLAAGALNLLLLVPVWMQLVHLLLADSVWITYVLLSASTLSMESEQELP